MLMDRFVINKVYSTNALWKEIKYSHGDKCPVDSITLMV
jgi:hypothetical protein